MPPSQSNSSFIPKRSPSQKAKKPRAQRLYVFSLIATALFVASLLASGAVFVYERQTQFNLAEAITDFNTAANNFSETDFARVTEFSNRVNTTKEFINSHVSLVELLSIFEQNTVGAAQVTSLAIERTDQTTVTANANLVTNAIDGALFQRDQYQRTPELSDLAIEDVSFIVPGMSGVVAPGEQLPVNLEMTFVFSADEILYSPSFTSQSLPEPDFVSEVEVSDSGLDTTESTDTDNNNGL